MTQKTTSGPKGLDSWRARMDITTLVALMALAISGLSFYRSYIYTKQQLDVTVTEVSYMTNEGELYMTVAFSNGGNRDAALLRVEPALWGRRAIRGALRRSIIGTRCAPTAKRPSLR